MFTPHVRAPERGTRIRVPERITRRARRARRGPRRDYKTAPMPRIRWYS